MDRTITLTPRELEMIMLALDTHAATLMRSPAAGALQLDQISEFNELHDDLLAEASGHHDDWSRDLTGHTFVVEEKELFNTGAEAFGEFQIRTGSLAAIRRQEMNKRMMSGTATSAVEDDD